MVGANKAFGKQLTWIDNYQELHDELKKAGKNQDYLWTFGTPLAEYAKQFEKMMVEFCKNSDNKEQLEAEFTTGQVGTKFNTELAERYWGVDDGTLWMYTDPKQFGNYLSYFDSDRLCKQLGKNDSMPLNTRKSLKASQVIIDKSMVGANKAFGKQLTWIDNYQELHDELKKSRKKSGLLVDFWDSSF